MSSLVPTKSSPWQKRLYDAYVSSGQAGARALAAGPAFASRRAYLTHLIAKHFPADRTARILDIGCGHGALLYFLSLAGYRNIAGVDTSPEQVETALKLGISNVVNAPAMEYVASQADESVDVVVLFDVLEHLEKQDLFDLLDQVYRILRPGALCLVHVPNGEGIFAMRVLFGDLTHRQAFTQTSLQQLLSTVGFVQIQSFEDRPVVHGITSLIRRILWEAGTVPFRLLLAAESGSMNANLSQNMVGRAVKPVASR